MTPTWWQRHGSRAFTRVFHRVLGQPNRYAHAGSLREESLILTPQQKLTLTSLLIKHELLQPQFAKLDPQRLQHYHLRKVVPERRIGKFMADFNEQFQDHLQIARVAGQFSITPPAPSLAKEPPSARSTIMRLLNKTNRPLNLSQIMEALPDFCRLERIKLPPGEVSERNISYEIGRLIERGTLQTSFAREKDVRRFFMQHRLDYHRRNRTLFEYTNEQGEPEYVVRKEGKSMVQAGQAYKIIGRDGGAFYLADSRFDQALHHTVFEYEDESGGKRYIEQGEADRLVLADKAYKFIDPEGSYAYMAANRFELHRDITTEVKTAERSFWVFNHDLDRLLKKGLVLTGLEEATFETRYIHHEAQRQYPFHIFNAFAVAFLDLEEKGSLSKYKQLRAAFSAGLKLEKPVSIPDFLYEAKILAEMGADLTTIIAALVKRPEAISRLKKSGGLQASQLESLAASFSRLAVISAMPLLFAPDQPDSLQNFIDHIYDKTETYADFQLLLALKLSRIRKLAVAGEQLPRSLRRQIELVYAPMASSKGFIRLANNMCDLVSRLVDPQRHEVARRKMEKEIGMDFNEARRHLKYLAKDLLEDLETDPLYNSAGNLSVIAVRTSVKEVSSLIEKEKADKRDALDYLRMRFICKTVEEAYLIAAFLQHKLKPIPDEAVHNRKAVVDRLDASGWQAWDGYFYDPKEDSRNIIHIQVLTEEMERQDKLGEAPHWSYKAGRSAEATALALEKKYKKQTFDPSAAGLYTGDPEKDYNIDQARARRHKRTFVWLSKDPIHANSFEFPEDGALPTLRLHPGDSVEDALALRRFGDILTRDYQAEIYDFRFNTKTGRIGLRPHYKGDGRVSRGQKVPNASLLVVRVGEDDVAPISIREARGSVRQTNLRAVLLTHPRHSHNRNKLIAEGKRSPLAKLLDTGKKQRRIVDVFKLKNVDEVWMLIAIDKINESMVETALQN